MVRRRMLGGKGFYHAPAGGGFTPASLSPSLWIEPAQSTMFQSNVGSGTGAAANGDNVGYIADLSGNGFHLTSAADDATRPTLQGVGVKPYLAFTSTQLLQRLASTGGYAAGACSWFVTCRVNGASGNTVLGEFNQSVSNTRYQLITVQATVTSASAFIRNAAGTIVFNNTNVLATSAFSSTVDKVNGVIDNGTQLIGYVDGAAGSTVGYTRSGTVTLDKLTLATGPTATRIYGVVCVNRVLTTQEISDLTTYMAALK